MRNTLVLTFVDFSFDLGRITELLLDVPVDDFACPLLLLPQLLQFQHQRAPGDNA
jgi:hypothetical protein